MITFMWNSFRTFAMRLPGEANAPTVPYGPLQIGEYQYQPNGDWQKSDWDGSAWVPNPGNVATGDMCRNLNNARTDMLSKSAAEQAAMEKALNDALPLSNPLSPLIPPGNTGGVNPPPSNPGSPNPPTTPPGGIAPTCGRDYGLARNYVPPKKDPLVLDLDGGGIVTSAINPAAPIYFDQDGDGTLTATGWIAAGEAIVVRDLNGNGLIDSGRELFGDATVLTHGPNAGQLAANGFAALADLDANASGMADGKFDSNDVEFASVKLWQDLNQDGISQSGELFSFAQLGVQSINLNASASNTALLDPVTGAATGNTQTFAGSFTKVGGAVGDAGTAQLAGSLLLSNDNFYRQFTDDPALTTQALNLPQMQGSGLVRDLRPALSLGTAQAQALQTQLTQFAADTTRTLQLAHLDALIQSWGATSAMPTSIQTNLTLANPADGEGRTCVWCGLFPESVSGFPARSIFV